MSAKSRITEKSKIFNLPELKRALARLPLKQAKKFAGDIGVKMESSPHTGKTVTKVRGENFRIRHQQSKRGERPAPFSRKLIGSFKARKTGEFTAEVNSDSPYVNKLIFEDGRVVISDKDLRDAKRDFEQEGEKIIKSFL